MKARRQKVDDATSSTPGELSILFKWSRRVSKKIRTPSARICDDYNVCFVAGGLQYSRIWSTKMRLLWATLCFQVKWDRFDNASLIETMCKEQATIQSTSRIFCVEIKYKCLWPKREWKRKQQLPIDSCVFNGSFMVASVYVFVYVCVYVSSERASRSYFLFFLRSIFFRFASYRSSVFRIILLWNKATILNQTHFHHSPCVIALQNNDQLNFERHIQFESIWHD